jgi:hypothetical protein
MIQLLPENYREAVTLSELKGLTQKEYEVSAAYKTLTEGGLHGQEKE